MIPKEAVVLPQNRQVRFHVGHLNTGEIARNTNNHDYHDSIIIIMIFAGFEYIRHYMEEHLWKDYERLSAPLF